MNIEFEKKCADWKVVMPTDGMAEICADKKVIPLMVELEKQNWIQSVYHQVVGAPIKVNYSPNYIYPEGEPKAALERLCQHVMDGKPEAFDMQAQCRCVMEPTPEPVQYTPGQWKAVSVRGEEGFYSLPSAGYEQRNGIKDYQARDDGNAKLMEAAPAMLEALQRITQTLTGPGDYRLRTIIGFAKDTLAEAGLTDAKPGE